MLDLPVESELWVSGDGLRLRQVVSNLLSNAIKFTDSGEVELKLRIFSEADSDQLALVLNVSDSGVGIAPSAQTEIFERFVQADGSTSRRHGGTGLGLAICRSLVELMGAGSIWPVERGKAHVYRASQPAAGVRACRRKCARCPRDRVMADPCC